MSALCSPISIFAAESPGGARTASWPLWRRTCTSMAAVTSSPTPRAGMQTIRVLDFGHGHRLSQLWLRRRARIEILDDVVHTLQDAVPLHVLQLLRVVVHLRHGDGGDQHFVEEGRQRIHDFTQESEEFARPAEPADKEAVVALLAGLERLLVAQEDPEKGEAWDVFSHDRHANGDRRRQPRRPTGPQSQVQKRAATIKASDETPVLERVQEGLDEVGRDQFHHEKRRPKVRKKKGPAGRRQPGRSPRGRRPRSRFQCRERKRRVMARTPQRKSGQDIQEIQHGSNDHSEGH